MRKKGGNTIKPPRVTLRSARLHNDFTIRCRKSNIAVHACVRCQTVRWHGRLLYSHFRRENRARGLPPRMAQKEVRCPYCVVDGKFRPMTVLPNGRLICKHCGHIVFPNDTAFMCPCSKCLEISFSPRVRRLRRR